MKPYSKSQIDEIEECGRALLRASIKAKAARQPGAIESVDRRLDSVRRGLQRIADGSGQAAALEDLLDGDQLKTTSLILMALSKLSAGKRFDSFCAAGKVLIDRPEFVDEMAGRLALAVKEERRLADVARNIRMTEPPEQDTCAKCGGSGGGDEPHLACSQCGGTGNAGPAPE